MQGVLTPLFPLPASLTKWLMDVITALMVVRKTDVYFAPVPLRTTGTYFSIVVNTSKGFLPKSLNFKTK